MVLTRVVVSRKEGGKEEENRKWKTVRESNVWQSSTQHRKSADLLARLVKAFYFTQSTSYWRQNDSNLFQIYACPRVELGWRACNLFYSLRYPNDTVRKHIELIKEELETISTKSKKPGKIEAASNMLQNLPGESKKDKRKGRPVTPRACETNVTNADFRGSQFTDSVFQSNFM